MVFDKNSPEMQKLKKEKTDRLKNTPWYCDICNNGKNYRMGGKWSHLGTKKHERNYYNLNPLKKL